MFGRKKQNINNQSKVSEEPEVNGTFSSEKHTFLKELKNMVNSPADLITKHLTEQITIAYIENLVDDQVLGSQIISELIERKPEMPEELPHLLSIPELKVTDQKRDIIYDMLGGNVVIHIDGHSRAGLANIATMPTRSLAAPENE